jgi:histone-lysine N-methyltransferase SETMAR
LQDKVRLALRHKQPELLKCGAILLQDNATPHRHRDVQNLVQRWGWKVSAHPPYSPDLAPCDYWFLRVKEHLRGKRFESEDNINTAVTASLKRLTKDEYRAAIDCLPRRWEKCVDSAGDCIE